MNAIYMGIFTLQTQMTKQIMVFVKIFPNEFLCYLTDSPLCSLLSYQSLWDPILCFPDKLLLCFGQDKDKGLKEDRDVF